MKTEVGPLWQRYLRIGVPEMSLMAFLGAEDRRRAMRARIASSGLLLQHAGSGYHGRVWEAFEDASGNLCVRSKHPYDEAGMGVLFGVLSDGTWILQGDEDIENVGYADTGVTVPDDGTWRTLVVKPAFTNDEPGKLTLTAASTTITGSLTDFTRYAGKTDEGLARGTWLYVEAADATAGNEGRYEIQEVVSATEVVVDRAPAVNQSDVPFSIEGMPFSGETLGDATSWRNRDLEWELKSARVQPDPSQYLVVCDVMLDTGSSADLQIMQRQLANELRFNESRRAAGIRVQPALQALEADTGALYDHGRRYVGEASRKVGTHTDWGASNSQLRHAIAPTRAGGLVSMLVSGQTSGASVGMRGPHIFDPVSDSWSGRDADQSLIGNQTSTRYFRDPSMVALPAPLAETHRVVFNVYEYSVSFEPLDDLYMLTSDDDGATWGTETTIWAPVDADDRVFYPELLLTRAGRLWCFATYYDSSQETYDIRAIYSDDYGDTWETNSGAGIVVYAPSNAVAGDYDVVCPRACEMEDGFIAVAMIHDTTGVDETWPLSSDHLRIARVSPTTGQWVAFPDSPSGTPTAPPYVEHANREGEDEFIVNGYDLVPLPGNQLCLLRTTKDASDGNGIYALVLDFDQRATALAHSYQGWRLRPSSCTLVAWYGGDSEDCNCQITGILNRDGAIEVIGETDLYVNEASHRSLHVVEMPRSASGVPTYLFTPAPETA